MAAQHLVQHDLRWNVGNEASIQIWSNRLLPSSSTIKVVSPRLFLNAKTQVSKLISQDSACWKSQVVDAIFLPHKVELIKPNKHASLWGQAGLGTTSNSLFSVSSAYKLATEHSRTANQGTNSDGSSSHRFWRLLTCHGSCCCSIHTVKMMLLWRS